MPNWCYTSYVATGDSKEVYDLYKKMKSLEDREESLVPNGFGKSWLGNLVSLLGGDWQKVVCRGDWNNLNISNDCSELRFNTESAWAEPYEVIEFLKGHYPNVHFYFQAEEDGCGYWVSNDADGIYFPERYAVDVWGDGIEYFEDLDKALSYLSKKIGKDIHSVEQAEEELCSFNENDDNPIFLKVFKVVGESC
jgi:hypothetical protein